MGFDGSIDGLVEGKNELETGWFSPSILCGCPVNFPLQPIQLIYINMFCWSSEQTSMIFHVIL
jgi:hypothetical protein